VTTTSSAASTNGCGSLACINAAKEGGLSFRRLIDFSGSDRTTNSSPARGNGRIASTLEVINPFWILHFPHVKLMTPASKQAAAFY
jgi:hypothetical protein